MRYHINEGAFDIPDDGRIDRTMNLLAKPDGSGLALIVSRETLQTGETLEQFVARQVRDLTRQVSQFKELSREPVQVGATAQDLKGVALATQFKQNGLSMRQRQAAFVMPNTNAVVVLTASAVASEFDERAEALWVHTLASFQLRTT